jgi:hypothetical protein
MTWAWMWATRKVEQASYLILANQSSTKSRPLLIDIHPATIELSRNLLLPFEIVRNNISDLSLTSSQPCHF